MNNLITSFRALTARLMCELREAQRLRRDMRELAAMSVHELQDLGISHASMAMEAPRAHPRCA